MLHYLFYFFPSVGGGGMEKGRNLKKYNFRIDSPISAYDKQQIFFQTL